MKHSTGKPTKAEVKRMDRLSQMACIACQSDEIDSPTFQASEIHHLLSGNKRRGHMYTIPLCPWHHRGVAPAFMTWNVELMAGPSLARSSKKFHAVFGTDDELLAITNRLLGGSHEPHD